MTFETYAVSQSAAKAGDHDWSQITSDERDWLEAKLASLPRTANGFDFSNVPIGDLDWMTWLANRCDPRGQKHLGGTDCECGSCRPPDALGVPPPTDSSGIWMAISMTLPSFNVSLGIVTMLPS